MPYTVTKDFLVLKQHSVKNCSTKDGKACCQYRNLFSRHPQSFLHFSPVLERPSSHWKEAFYNPPCRTTLLPWGRPYLALGTGRLFRNGGRKKFSFRDRKTYPAWAREGIFDPWLWPSGSLGIVKTIQSMVYPSVLRSCYLLNLETHGFCYLKTASSHSLSSEIMVHWSSIVLLSSYPL